MMLVGDILRGLQRLMERFTPYLNEFVTFFIILFIGFLVGKILGRLTRKLLADLKADLFARQRLGWKLSVERGLSSLVAGLVYLVSIILALNAVGLATAVFVAILSILLLALLVGFLLALKDVIPNAAAGLTHARKLRPGMRIRMEEAEGRVAEIGLLETAIETKGGDRIIVPNALLAKRAVRVLRGAKK